MAHSFHVKHQISHERFHLLHVFFSSGSVVHCPSVRPTPSIKVDPIAKSTPSIVTTPHPNLVIQRFIVIRRLCNPIQTTVQMKIYQDRAHRFAWALQTSPIAPCRPHQALLRSPVNKVQKNQTGCVPGGANAKTGSLPTDLGKL